MTQLQSKCSRAGCEASATMIFEWRNPAVHKDGRLKHWGSCGDHKEFFEEYLGVRGFLIEVRDL